MARTTVSTRRRIVGPTSAPLHRQSRSATTPPLVKEFVKVIVDSAERFMLMIPSQFVRHGPKLADIVILETPAGFRQSILLERLDGNVWFEGGWHEFAEHNSIDKGHLLMFQYQEDSRFRVVIFDRSASEINYITGERDNVIEVGNQGTKQQENVTNVSNKCKGRTMASDSALNMYERKKYPSLIDDVKVEVIDVDELPETSIKIDRRSRQYNTRNRANKTLNRESKKTMKSTP